MTLQNNGAISMLQIRTEFGQSGSLAMNQLYKDGGIVPSTQSGTSTTTVGASISSLAGSPVVSAGHFGGNFFNNNQAQLTGTITCGNNGNVTANGNIVFTASGSNNNSATDVGGAMSGGVRIVSSNATFNSAGNVTSGTQYTLFTGVASAWTCTGNSGNCDSGFGSVTTTIPSGTSLQIPNGVTSFKILTYGFCNARVRGDGSGGYEGSAGLTLNNGSGSITSTTTTSTTTNINTNVPTNGTITFQNFYGATA